MTIRSVLDLQVQLRIQRSIKLSVHLKTAVQMRIVNKGEEMKKIFPKRRRTPRRERSGELHPERKHQAVRIRCQRSFPERAEGGSIGSHL